MIPLDSETESISLCDENTSPTSKTQDKEGEDSNGPKFKPGDHVIRWKLLKIMVWPIQIHGIVLKVDERITSASNGPDDQKDQQQVEYVYTIADFGYTSNQYENSKHNNNNDNLLKIKKSFSNINEKMKNFYETSAKNLQSSSHDSRQSYMNDSPFSSFDENISEDVKEHELNTNAHIVDKEDIKVQCASDQSIKDKKSTVDHRIHKNDNILKIKRSFSDKMKSIYESSTKNLQSLSNDAKESYMDITQYLSFDEIITNKKSIENDNNMGDEAGAETTKVNKGDANMVDENDIDITKKIDDTKVNNADCDVADENDTKMDMNDFNAALLDAEKESPIGRKRFEVIEISNPDDVKKWHKIDYGKSLLEKNKFKEKVTQSGKNLMEKLKFLQRKDDNYSHLASSQDEEDKSATPQTLNDDAPKLPKSDPYEIVLARTQYILDQQELPESEQTLPPFHILYSNSECLAVWCKTGKFSTIQAAVFLHSTAVGNAKSTFLMTGAVAATQPWLIPVVGIYGAVAIGMPYLMLKKCKEKWKESELQMTDGFWATADAKIYVSAIVNWSNMNTTSNNEHEQKL